jgi:hypothetical protein
MSAEASALDTIINALAKYGGKQKRHSRYTLVVCPFHDDSRPSLSVNIGNPKVPIGTFNCWSCPASGHWNKFAKKAGLPEIKHWQSTEATMFGVSESNENELLGTDVFRLTELARELKLIIITDWNASTDWRSFSGKLINSLDGKLAVDNRTDEQHLLFPILIDGDCVGAVKAVLHKKKGMLSYVNSGGTWVRTQGIFPYDYTQRMLLAKKYKFIILVEGPRDALRLLHEGLPAVACLGSLNFSNKKLHRIISMGVAGDIDHVFVMSDNDSGGDSMYKLVKSTCKELDITPRRVRFPKTINGERVELDPCRAPQYMIENFKTYLRSQHLY